MSKILKFRKKNVLTLFILCLMTLAIFLYYYDKKTREKEESDYNSIFGDLDVSREFEESSFPSTLTTANQVAQVNNEVSEDVNEPDEIGKKLSEIMKKMDELEGRFNRKRATDDENQSDNKEMDLRKFTEKLENLEKMVENQKTAEKPFTKSDQNIAKAASESWGKAELPIKFQPEDRCGPNEVYSSHCRSCMSIDKTGSKRLHYVHIPKAAGSSFSVPLRHYFDCEPAGKGCWGDPKNTVGGNIDCGGQLIGCYGIIPLTQKHSVAMFREPVSRILSAYSDGKQYPAGTTEEKIQLQQLSLTEYSNFPGVSNCQTKMMLGKSCTDKNPLIDLDIERAKANMMSLDFFGLQEYYKTSVCLFFKTLGGYPNEDDFQLIKKNIRYNKDLEDEIRNAIESSENYDIILYKKAKELFLENVKKKGLQILD